MSYVWLKLNLSSIGYQSLLYHLMVNELWNYFLLRLILPNIEMYLKTKLIMRYLHTQPCTFSRKTFKSEGNKIYIWYISPPPFPPNTSTFYCVLRIQCLIQLHANKFHILCRLQQIVTNSLPCTSTKSVSSGYGTKVSISIQYSAIIYHIICAKLPIGVSINFPCFLITKSKLNI